MSPPSSVEITQLLERFREGDQLAAEELLPLVYDHLHYLATIHLSREYNNNTLQPTALVNEVYLRLFKGEHAEERVAWKNRRHFFVIAAKQMRRVLVDYARARNADKRGGEQERVDFDGALLVTPPFDIDLLALEEALQRLETLHPRPAKIIELRFFGGLTEEEAAEALEISVSTLRRDWEFARAWLLDKLSP